MIARKQAIPKQHVTEVCMVERQLADFLTDRRAVRPFVTISHRKAGSITAGRRDLDKGFVNDAIFVTPKVSAA